MYWFTSRQVSILKWPQDNADLNPAENLWATLKWQEVTSAQQAEIGDDTRVCLFAWYLTALSAQIGYIVTMP